MKALIFCAGGGERWKNHGNIPKQLAEVEGVTVLQRTLNQCVEHDLQPIIVTNDEDLMLDGHEVFNSSFVEYWSSTVLSTRPLWSDQVIGLLGDVWFSVAAFKSIVDQAKRDPTGCEFFGRQYPSRITGGPPEIFAVRWHESNLKFIEALEASIKHGGTFGDEVIDRFNCPIGTPYQPYRHMIGIPLETPLRYDFDLFTEIDDWTDDFDNADRYQEWLQRYEHRMIVQGPQARVENAHKLQYVATGTGHCGTGYVAMLLRSAGVYCGHEGIFSRGFNPRGLMKYWADSSWGAAPFLDNEACKGAKIIHIVRHPLKVLRSWKFAGHGAFLEEYVDLPDNLGEWDYLAAWYVAWNKLIESKAPDALRYQVEDRTKLLELLDLPQVHPWDNDKYNHKHWNKSPELQWSDLPGSEQVRELKRMAIEYGYND
jgi:hypothetical protein